MSSTKSAAAAKRSADADDIKEDKKFAYDERYDVDDDEDWEEEDDNAIDHGDYSDSECEEEGEEDADEDTSTTKEDESTGVKFISIHRSAHHYSLIKTLKDTHGQ